MAQCCNRGRLCYRSCEALLPARAAVRPSVSRDAAVRAGAATGRLRGDAVGAERCYREGTAVAVLQ